MGFFDYGVGEEAPTDVEFLTGWSHDDLRALLASTTPRRLHAGEALLREGQASTALYVVAAGTLAAYAGAGRRRRLLRTMGEGSVVGEVTFVDGGGASADVLADGDAEVLMLTRERFDAWAAAHPDLARAFLFELGRVLAHRLRTLTRAVTK